MKNNKKSNEKLNDAVYGTLSSFDRIKLLIEEEHNMCYDTIEVRDEGKIKYNEVLLPKSKVMSYHLYKISDTKVLTALKHPIEPANIEESDMTPDSIGKFMKRSSLYIHQLLQDKPVEIITYPQSPSDFNKELVDYIMENFNESPEIKRIPNLFIKDIKRAYVNTYVAKKLGLPDYEIHLLMEDVERWKEDAEILKFQAEMDELKDSIASAAGKRGRPTREISTKKEIVINLEHRIELLKKERERKYKEKSKNEKEKNFEIDSIEERRRRSIEGLFDINPKLKDVRQDLRGKHIVVFDDHISSGATLDDICCELQKYNVASVLPITLAVIPKVPTPR